jgi:hypothetical protein
MASPMESADTCPVKSISMAELIETTRGLADIARSEFTA